MKKLLSTLFILIVIGVYFFKLLPNLEQLKLEKSNTQINFSEAQKIKWPWLGIKLKKPSAKYEMLSWKADNADFVLTTKALLFAQYQIKKISMDNLDVSVNNKFSDWLRASFQTQLAAQPSLPNNIRINNYKIDIHNSHIKFQDLELSNIEIYSSSIETDSPFTLNIEGVWNKHPISFSALATFSGKGLRLDNTHLYIENLSEDFGMSRIKINADISINKDYINFSNLAIMSPEARLQGNAKVNLNSFVSSGQLDLPTAPCNNALSNLNLALSSDALQTCHASIKWQDKKLSFSLKSDNLTASGNIDLLQPEAKSSVLKINGGDIASFYQKSSGTIKLHALASKWFSKIDWQQPQINKLKLKSVSCIKNNAQLFCKANIKSGQTLEFELRDFNLGNVKFNALPINTALLAFGVDGSELSGDLNGQLYWHRKDSALIYRGDLSSKTITLDNWHFKDYLNNTHISDKIEPTSGKKELWHNVKIDLSGLNNIINLKEITADSVLANGIVDLAYGVTSIDVHDNNKKYSLVGTWPGHMYLIEMLPGTDLNRRPSD